MINNIIKVKGMHCRACELLIEQSLKENSAVSSVVSNWKKGEVNISYDENKISIDEIKSKIEKAGFKTDTNSNNIIEEKFSLRNSIKELLFALIIFGILLYFFYILNPFNNIGFSLNNISYSTAFLVGLTAGVSTCIALVGGLILAISAEYNKNHEEIKTIHKIIPHIYFNIGRIFGFVLLGGVLGLVGSLLNFSSSMSGFIIIAVSLFMLFMGLKLLNIFQLFNNFHISIPKRFSKIFFNDNKKNRYSNIKTVTIGALTFFLPCGFTQLMQSYAITTQNFLTGGLIMGLFALGTTPGLIGIGSVTAFIKGNKKGIFFKVVALVLISFAIFNFKNGYNLTIPVLSTKAVTKTAVTDSSSIELKTTFTLSKDIFPNVFKVKAGQKVKLIIDAKEDGEGCMQSFMIPAIYDNPINIVKGKNIIEFTANKKGTFPITCAMGVKRGKLIIE